MAHPANYTVGWICALSTEYVAAQAFLDERHGRPNSVSPNDHNDYTLGRVGQHNVVIAVLPEGQYGESTASKVASDMLHTFTNVRVGLMVGIGGGVPNPGHDIRLGDIVVSSPRGGFGGVVHYQFGQDIQGQDFKLKGFLNQPPLALRAAMNGLSAQHELDGCFYDEAIADIISKRPRLKKKYSRPDPETDRLFKPTVVHPKDQDLPCEQVCKANVKNLINRQPRSDWEDSPAIHYGLIASGNYLMKNAIARDEASQDKGILCFEMEAAGLMNNFPCVVIRGICDYADTHKNDVWHGYAAMAAAAYAKDLLYRMAPRALAAENSLGDIFPDICQVLEEQRILIRESLQVHQDTLRKEREEETRKCHHLFLLTTNDGGASYESYKAQIADRVKNTCLWFCKHPHFQKWSQELSGLLLVSSDPGCGKSVLAKYLVDEFLPQSSSTTTRTICYFFFKEQDQNTACQALCAILHQLFLQQPKLLKYAIDAFRTNGERVISTSASLWKIFSSAIKDPIASPITIVLDALDECADRELEDLLKGIGNQLLKPSEEPVKVGSSGKVKYVLTSRPYELVISTFRKFLSSFPYIHIPGENESDEICEEVNHVITHRVTQLAQEKGLSSSLKLYIEKRLKEIPHRTYLWVHFIFKDLEKKSFKRTVSGFDSAIKTSPRSVDEAYDQILSKSSDDPIVRKILCIILSAQRSLSLSELNIAVNLRESTRSTADLDLDEEENFKTCVRSWCGLFVSIHHRRVYLLHQTARDFLVRNPRSSVPKSPDLRWKGSISMSEAHAALGTACVWYLNLFNDEHDVLAKFSLLKNNSHVTRSDSAHDSYSICENDGSNESDSSNESDGSNVSNSGPRTSNYTRSFDRVSGTQVVRRKRSSASLKSNISYKSYMSYTEYITTEEEFYTQLKKDFEFFDYAAANWGDHIREANLDTDSSVLQKGISLCVMHPAGCEIWFPAFWASNHDILAPTGFTGLMVASLLGQNPIAKILLSQGADVHSRCQPSERSALFWAIEAGYDTIVQLLIRSNAKINTCDTAGITPLSLAIKQGRVSIAKLLLTSGANVDSMDEQGSSLLSLASIEGWQTIVQMLIEAGADVRRREPLENAARHGHVNVAKLLLEAGADASYKEPLLLAVQSGHETIVQLLLESGADPDDEELILSAIGFGHKPVVQLLLDTGYYSGDERALALAARAGDHDMIQLLLNAGAYPSYLSPLLLAIGLGHETVVQLLLRSGVAARYKEVQSLAARGGNCGIIQLLLDSGADPNNHALFLTAIEFGHKDVVQLLLDAGAKTRNREALSLAAEFGHEGITQLLLDHGADPHNSWALSYAVKNGYERIFQLLHNSIIFLSTLTPNDGLLLNAINSGHFTIVKLLLEAGADPNCYSTTHSASERPLVIAIKHRRFSIVRLLLDRGASVHMPGWNGEEPLLIAVRLGQRATAKLLLGRGANLEKTDYSGWTPLCLAVKMNNAPMVKLLLNEGAEPNIRDRWGRTLLHGAIQWGTRLFIVKKLLETGADPNSTGRGGYLPLFLAVQNQDIPVIKLLLKEGADTSRTWRNQTLLLLPIIEGNTIMVSLLINAGVDVNLRCADYAGTALGVAAFNGHKTIVMLLIVAGANIHSKDRNGYTALHLAAEGGHGDILQLLLRAGADVNARDLDHRTPLIIAIRYRRLEIAKQLIDSGADVNMKDTLLRTPLEWASYTRCGAIIEVLLNAGARPNSVGKNGRKGVLQAYKRRKRPVIIQSGRAKWRSRIRFKDVKLEYRKEELS